MAGEKRVFLHGNTRWTPVRKAGLVAAIDRGDLTVLQAKLQHGLSDEELVSWRRALDMNGHKGLRATRVQVHPEQRATAAGND